MQEHKLVAKTKKKVVQILSRDERQEKLKKLFKEHIGREKGISQLFIFRHLYGDPSNYSDMEIFFIWAKIKHDMNWIRKTTKAFIGLERQASGWKYFVVKDQEDVDPYIALMSKCIERCRYMSRRAQKAVDEKFYKEI
jgi:hypothetical protein